MICRVCLNSTVPFAEALLLGRHQVRYFSCEQCGFIQTEEPYWLAEAYSSVITQSDVGLVSRNLIFATIGKAVIRTFFDANARFLDYDGGYGLLVRLMRDAGFDFYRHDKHCVYSNGKSHHLFTEKKISALLFKWVTHYRVARVIGMAPARPSLLAQDHARAASQHPS